MTLAICGCSDAYSEINRRLLDEGCITQDIKGIKFRDFRSNLDRVEFLTGFKDINASGVFFNGEVVNIRFKPDEALPTIPDDLKPYLDKVRNLDINGSLLEELPHIEEDSYKNAILLSRIKIRFRFEIDGNKGECDATIGFPSILNGKTVDDTTELVVSVEVLKSKNSQILIPKGRLQNRLSRRLDQVIQSKYFTVYDIA